MWATDRQVRADIEDESMSAEFSVPLRTYRTRTLRQADNAYDGSTSTDVNYNAYKTYHHA